MTNGNLGLSSQIFRWFEKMKTNYENNIKHVLARFEQQQEKQQGRIDKSHQTHLDNLKHSYQQQIADKDKQIAQLEQQINFYQQQIVQQQKAAEQLNTRYDTVVTCLLTEQKANSNIKDIFAEDEFPLQKQSTNLVMNSEPEQATKQIEQQQIHAQQQVPEQLYQQAVSHRNQGELAQAFSLFEQAAINKQPEAMGALGRAYFLSEGVAENHALGLAWLINAANLDFTPAANKVSQFRENDPELYIQALELSAQLEQKIA